MYEELIRCLRICGNGFPLANEAADAIEELSARVDRLQFFADNISKLPDCNTCFKKDMCEFIPRYGDYTRINCPHWLEYFFEFRKSPEEEDK